MGVHGQIHFSTTCLLHSLTEKEGLSNHWCRAFWLRLCFLWLNRHIRWLGLDPPEVNHQNHQREMNERDEHQISSLTLYDDEVRGEGYHPAWECSNDREGFSG